MADSGPGTMSDETRWLTYDELAAALRIAPDSARRLVARRRWPRMTGNDGKARIQVPIERLTPDSPSAITRDIEIDAAADSKADSHPDAVSPIMQVLMRHLERVEKDLENVKAERDREQSRAAGLAVRIAEVETARAALEGEAATLKNILTNRDLELGRERERVADLSARLMNATVQATEAAGMRDGLTARLEAVSAELQALRSRPWWRRVIG